METEDIIKLPDPSISGDGGESNENHKLESGPGEADSPPNNNEKVGEDLKNRDNFGLNDIDIVAKIGMTGPETLKPNENNFGTDKYTKGSIDLEMNGKNIKTEEESLLGENQGESLVYAVKEEAITDGDNLVLNQGYVMNESTQLSGETEVDMDLVDSPIRQVNIEVAETVAVSGNLSSFGFNLKCQNGCLNAEIHNHLTHGGPVSGVKRARITYDEQQPSVHVAYNSLTSASKRKLKELLQQWSEWHVQHGSSSQNLDEVLESGEETYFPALYVGTEKSSAVSFWIENQTKKQKINDFNPDGDSVPVYDRGFALGLTSTDGPSNAEGGLEIVDEAARCFNCGSYNHSLKECPKPRDNVAVNNARKLHKSKRNQNAGSRNATRYYQNSSGGKYDSLKPGSLDAETRRLLGLGEFDPPPWLNRMRELGYPPGYLDLDDEDQPSGITIFVDGDSKEEHEDGEIIETENPDPPGKEAVEFPGINAPIPENADERVWAVWPSSHDPYRNRPRHKPTHSSETIGRWYHHERRGSRDSFDEGPPGVNSAFSTSSHLPRYGNYDSGYGFGSPRRSIPSIARSHSEKEWSHFVDEARLFEDETNERLKDSWLDYSRPINGEHEDDRHRYHNRW